MKKDLTLVTFDVTGNDNKDVDLCLISGPFDTDSPSVIERYTRRRYDQILSERDEHPLVNVKGNMASLGQTIWMLHNMDEVYGISITSPTKRLKQLDLEFEFSVWNGQNSLGHSDFVEVRNYVTNPSEAHINLMEEPIRMSLTNLFFSLNVKRGSSFSLSFVGQLKECVSPPVELFTRKTVPPVCKSCGAPLQDGKCNYCGVEYN